jgi:hypothetical protein
VCGDLLLMQEPMVKVRYVGFGVLGLNSDSLNVTVLA